MPQLMPDPWFAIFITSWLTLMMLAPKKILSHKILNEPNPKSTKVQQNPWTWPWL
uniref:ATP synthase complex subunit 8 n=1 Tax=Trichobatrachus robustus TaxID=111096 RepID=W0TH36_TRIRB|nr:ATP synthase F0 subunit 8 [Trichobatrachus robustus]BAO42927.1 ATPase subunit 8 [Trichobatrachus robustus]